MDLIVSSDATVGISVGPFEGLGAFVVGFDIASDFAGEVGFGSKDAAGPGALRPPAARSSRGTWPHSRLSRSRNEGITGELLP